MVMPIKSQCARRFQTSVATVSAKELHRLKPEPYTLPTGPLLAPRRPAFPSPRLRSAVDWIFACSGFGLARHQNAQSTTSTRLKPNIKGRYFLLRHGSMGVARGLR